MNANLDLDLLLYGVLLVGLGLLAHRLTPGWGYANLIPTLAGGVLAVVLGILGLRGYHRRIWTFGTLTALDITLLVQSVKAWVAISGGLAEFKAVAVILTVLLVFGVGQLVNVIQASNRKQ